MTHKEANARWASLKIGEKIHGLNAIHRFQEAEKMRAIAVAARRKAEKGKRVGKECTCTPGEKASVYVDVKCEYCKNAYWDDYNRSPG